MVVVGILAPNLHQFHRTTTEKYIFWRIKSQYVKFGFFGEKSTVKNIKGSLAAYVKRMRTWKCLKTKEILDLNGPWYYQPIWMFWQHWKKLKTRFTYIHKHVSVAIVESWKVSIFRHRFLCSLKFPWHSH